MSTLEQPRTAATHEVVNQATPLEDYNTFEADRVLIEALRREGGDWAEQRVSEVGAFAGSARAIRWGAEANENPPKLTTHDRFGNRIDEVEFHPAWHELLGAGVAHGAACAALARAAARAPTSRGRRCSSPRRPRPGSAARSR